MLLSARFEGIRNGERNGSRYLHEYRMMGVCSNRMAGGAMSMTRRQFVKMTGVAGVSALMAQDLASCATQTNYDVAVIGAGVIGCCTARELARYRAKVLVIEGGLDVACGATRANSGIVHTGYDPQPGTLKARYNVEGAKLFPTWQQELGFTYYKNGALVLAFSEDDMATLEELRQRARENGAPETTIIGQEALRELEPNVSADAIGALSVPDSGVCDPYGLTLAAAENAADNGVEFLFGFPVASVAAASGGYTVATEAGGAYTARAVVNAAGINSDTVNNMVSATKLTITPKRGEYHLYENTIHAFSHTMFQTPGAKGKGVLVGVAAFGNQFCGPNSQVQESRTDVATTQEGLSEVLEKAVRTWPDAAKGNVISNFAGLRAPNADTGDFVIGQAADAPGFFNAACIDSPGLASAPAIAQDVAQQVAGYLGAGENQEFNPQRTPAPLLVMMDDAQKEALIQQDAAYGREICHCCHVTEGELVAALHRSVPVGCLDALKWRTGATMGPCQGGRCTAKIAQIVLRELEEKAPQLQKRFAGSALVLECACSSQGSESVQEQEATAETAADEPFELPRSHWRIPGSRCAGVYSARCTMDLMDTLGYLPGTNAVVWGSTALARQCAEKLQEAGAAVTVIQPAAETLTCINGTPRVEEAVFTAADGTQRTLACDLLVVSAEMSE